MLWRFQEPLLSVLLNMSCAGFPFSTNSMTTNQLSKTLFAKPVFVHTHTDTVTHSRRSSHASRLRLVCPFRPGMDGCPHARANFREFCGDLDAQLGGLSSTLEHARTCAAQKLEATASKMADSSSASQEARALMNESLAVQLAVQECMMRAWLQPA
jgi:hypothetical protein